jgi:hypothetical protein
MMVTLPEKHKRRYFTTARIIHTPNVELSQEDDWLWVNTFSSHEFDSRDEAQTLADLANHNGSENGINVVDYPYFVVRVTRASEIERV